MDPYIPQFSRPVSIDSVASRKLKRIRYTLLTVFTVLVLLLLTVTLSEAYADESGMDKGQVVVYREVSKRPAVRPGYPAQPVAVSVGAAEDRVAPLADSSLVEINTQQAGTVRLNVSHSHQGTLHNMAGIASDTIPVNRRLSSPIAHTSTGVSNVLRATSGSIGSSISTLQRATPATPAVPNIPGSR